MKRVSSLLWIACLGCGSLENAPLRSGVIQGQLRNADASALVAVVGREDLRTTPDAEGRFELRAVPTGTVDLVIIINALESTRVSVQLEAASIADLGVVTPLSSALFEFYVLPPGGQLIVGGRIGVSGLPLSAPTSSPENEAHLRLPPGCYLFLVSAAGLGEVSVSVCGVGGGSLERRVTLPAPDGTSGHEGCTLTGCVGLLRCQADRSCQ